MLWRVEFNQYSQNELNFQIKLKDSESGCEMVRNFSMECKWHVTEKALVPAKDK